MTYTGLSKTIKLGPEDRECILFANDLRVATIEGRLLAVWTHCANQLAGVGKVTNGKFRVLPQAAIAKALGLITGSSDYLFLHRAGSLAMEFKSSTGTLTQGQKDFRAWCEALGVPFHLVRSREEALSVLREAGLLVEERRW